jgi:uncharacterized membrane protein
MLQEIMDSLADPHARHAMMVHWPIVLMPVAVLLLGWFAATRFKSKPVGIAAVLALLGAMAGAGLASGAGEEAYEAVKAATPALTAAEEAALERHEELGEGAWLWPGACVLLAAGGLLPKPKKAAPLLASVALLASIGVSARFAWTAHTGGSIVYDHGLGVPPRGQLSSLPPAAGGTHGAESEDDD